MAILGVKNIAYYLQEDQYFIEVVCRIICWIYIVSPLVPTSLTRL